MHRMKNIAKKSSPIVKDSLSIQSPPPMGPPEAVHSPTTQSFVLPPPQERPGILQRARRNLRGSSSSASDGPSVNSETSASSVDASPQPSSQPLTLMQRIRMDKPDSPETPFVPSPANVELPVVPMTHARTPKRPSVPTPETVFAQSPPLSAFSVHSPPPSTALKSAGTVTSARPRLSIPEADGRARMKMSPKLLSLLVYTVGIKCRGINKKEEYAPEHMFSLSERATYKMLRFGMWDLIKHTKTHLVRTYPKGTRVRSTNHEPHSFWAAGAQLVALNWQTFGESPLRCYLFCSLIALDFGRDYRSGIYDQLCYVSEEWTLGLRTKARCDSIGPERSAQQAHKPRIPCQDHLGSATPAPQRRLDARDRRAAGCRPVRRGDPFRPVLAHRWREKHCQSARIRSTTRPGVPFTWDFDKRRNVIYSELSHYQAHLDSQEERLQPRLGGAPVSPIQVRRRHDGLDLRTLYGQAGG